MDVKILELEHPEVKAMRDAWTRIQILLEEDEANYTSRGFYFPFPNESPTEQEKRKEPFRMGFFNPTQELVSTAGDFILRQKIDRQTELEPLKAFMDRADQGGQSMGDFVKNQASPNLRAYGTVFGVVDKPRGVFLSRADEQASGMPYLCILHPLQIKNWAYGRDGKLLWFRYIQTENVDASDPLAMPKGGGKEYVTWTPQFYLRHNDKGRLVESFQHGFGVVPVAIQSAFMVDSDRTLGKSTFFSSSRHLIMGNNHLSKANMEILRFGSILIVGMNDWDPYKRQHLMDPDTNLPRVTSEERSGEILAVTDPSMPPKYLEKSIEIVDKANAQAWKYFGLAAQCEATGKEVMPLEDAQKGPQSGVSKAYDFQDMDANLYTHAMDLQAFETQVLNIVSAILKVAPSFAIRYPSSFDVGSFKDKIDEILRLDQVQFPSELGRKIALKRLTPDLTPDPDEQQKINAEIDASTAPDPLIAPPKIKQAPQPL